MKPEPSVLAVTLNKRWEYFARAGSEKLAIGSASSPGARQQQVMLAGARIGGGDRRRHLGHLSPAQCPIHPFYPLLSPSSPSSPLHLNPSPPCCLSSPSLALALAALGSRCEEPVGECGHQSTPAAHCHCLCPVAARGPVLEPASCPRAAHH